MKRPYISPSLRQQIADSDKNRCSYCQTQVAVVGNTLELDHIIPIHAGGASQAQNLCLACSSCNQAKSSKISAIDPVSEKTEKIFNPRQQKWQDHFRWIAGETKIEGITAIGRATVMALNMNRSLIVKTRARWVKAGWHPPME